MRLFSYLALYENIAKILSCDKYEIQCCIQNSFENVVICVTLWHWVLSHDLRRHEPVRGQYRTPQCRVVFFHTTLMSGLFALEVNVNESSEVGSVLPAEIPELTFVCFCRPLRLCSVMIGKEFPTIFGHAHHHVTLHARVDSSIYF